jgi:protein gp37
MGADTKIEWATHTFNPWVGCAKISDACRSCYAESWAKRTGQADLWRGERRRTSVANWRLPLRWNRETPGARVFCASLADVFEGREDLDPWRDQLHDLIAQTPALTWLLLTKRPRHAAKYHGIVELPNVWVGTTVEHQAAANERIPALLEIPARVRFLSMEPLLGPVDLSRWLGFSDTWDRWVGPCGCEAGRDPWSRCDDCADRGWEPPTLRGLQWVIAGGESGGNARATDPAWAHSLRDQCVAAGVPFLWKQWGQWAPHPNQDSPWAGMGRTTTTTPGGILMVRHADKHAAGRELAGRTWDEVPRVG